MLSQFVLTNAKPREKPYKLTDGDGLSLIVQPNGSKLWRFRYRFGGKENMLTFGAFPEVSLADARERRTEARKLLAKSIDPSQQRKQDIQIAALARKNTFAALTKEYLEQLRERGLVPSTIEKNKWALERLAAPLADRPITEITPAEVLAVLKKVEKSGRRETARKLRAAIGAIFRLAITTQRATNDPTYPLRGALLPPIVKHYPAITDEHKLGALMRCIDEYDGWVTVRAALLFLMLTTTRSGDVRHMLRSEVNFTKALWTIPAARMKMRREHVVPLSTQALTILRDVWELSEGTDGLVFPSIRSLRKPLSDNAFNSALRRMGYHKDNVTAHGFRSSASTILNERGFNSDHIEAALAHRDKNEVRRAYNRASYIKERASMMQAWADLLDEFRSKSSYRAA
jgi:integrase